MLARAVSPGRPSLVWNVRHSLYDIAQERRGTRWAIRIAAALSRFVDRIVYNSDLSKLQHEAFGFCGAQASVIGNGFDTESWCPNLAARRETRRSLGLSDDDRLVGFVARYHPMKDVPTFLKALAIAMADDARLHCAMVGRDTGPDNPSLARLIANLPAARMHFLGQREDVHKLMNGFDLFCLSSWSEAFPNVLGEAMACGVPCVSTEVGDSRRIIGDTGFVVPRSDPEAMACALMKALAEPLSVRLERGKAARQRIEDNFSLQFCVNQYREVYEALRARQRSTGNPLR
nr:glycosyltransferase [Mesorhizobium sp.]